MKIKDCPIALLRLNKRRELLFSEYMRAKKGGLTKVLLVRLLYNVLKKNKDLPLEKQAYEIMKKLLEVGGVDDTGISKD